MPLRVLVDEVPQTEEIAKTCDGFIKMVILCLRVNSFLFGLKDFKSLIIIIDYD